MLGKFYACLKNVEKRRKQYYVRLKIYIHRLKVRIKLNRLIGCGYFDQNTKRIGAHCTRRLNYNRRVEELNRKS